MILSIKWLILQSGFSREGRDGSIPMEWFPALSCLKIVSRATNYRRKKAEEQGGLRREKPGATFHHAVPGFMVWPVDFFTSA